MSEDHVRDQAIERLRRRRGFYQYLASAIALNAFMVIIWALSGAGFFWPGFVMAGSLMALAARAPGAFGGGEPTEAQIEAEAAKLRGGG